MGGGGGGGLCTLVLAERSKMIQSYLKNILDFFKILNGLIILSYISDSTSQRNGGSNANCIISTLDITYNETVQCFPCLATEDQRKTK